VDKRTPHQLMRLPGAAAAHDPKLVEEMLVAAERNS